MSVETFSRQEFEAALPADKETGLPMCTPAGVVNGEYAYVLNVRGPVSIMIRSSVRVDGMSAPAGEDSIRLWLVDNTGKPLMKKLTRWVTRQPGWQGRLTEQARRLFKMGLRLKPCQCGHGVPVIRKVKEGSNAGKLFTKCDHCGAFNWFEDPLAKK